MPIDRGLGQEAGAGLWPLVNAVFPPGSLPLPQVVDVERNAAGGAANRQITRDAVIIPADHDDSIPTKPDFGKVFHIKKVRTAQVRIARRLAGPDLARVDRDLRGRLSRILRIKLQPAMHVLKVSPDISDHHVPSTQFGRRVSGFESPFSHA